MIITQPSKTVCSKSKAIRFFEQRFKAHIWLDFHLERGISLVLCDSRRRHCEVWKSQEKDLDSV